MPRTSAWRAVSSGSQMLVFEMLPAIRSPGRWSATSRAICERGAVQRLEQVLLADDPHLLAVAVVGERLDDVRAGALVVDVQRPEGVRVLQGDLGDELAGAQVAAALQLEQEALGTDHGSGVQALGQVPLGARWTRSTQPSISRGSARHDDAGGLLTPRSSAPPPPSQARAAQWRSWGRAPWSQWRGPCRTCTDFPVLHRRRECSRRSRSTAGAGAMTVDKRSDGGVRPGAGRSAVTAGSGNPVKCRSCRAAVGTREATPTAGA